MIWFWNNPGCVMFLGLSTWELIFCVLAILGAGFVRGYSGFGSSALIMTSLALVIPPSEIVPIALVMEVAATVALVRNIRGHIAWKPLGWIFAGAAFATPVGMVLLSELSADTVRLVLSAIILIACVFLWRNSGEVPRAKGRLPALLAGVVSGTANGIAAVGGLPAVLYLLMINTSAAVFRANGNGLSADTRCLRIWRGADDRPCRWSVACAHRPVRSAAPVWRVHR